MRKSTNKPEGVECKRILPFLKWAGGKRWLANQFLHLFPSTYDRYIEPFLGGGSVFFALTPADSILGDSNHRLMETYEEIRRNPTLISDLLHIHHLRHSNEYYYLERGREYLDSPAERAAQFIYLNRTCWNGLYRVNRRGEFNVPRGTKTAVSLDSDDFPAVASTLSGATLVTQDFAKTIGLAREGDFVYVDPPYTVKHKSNGFIKYNEKIFSWQDQVRLRDEVILAIDRGALVAVSNADHYSILDLYRNVGSARKISRSSVIAGAAAQRGNVDELFIMSWNIDAWPNENEPIR